MTTLEQVANKVPAVTAIFWIIKIICTTLGETAGDTFSMSWQLGYLVSTGIFFAVMAVLVYFQIRAKQFHPYLYWSTIIASTTLGTTLADFADRSLGIGYPGGSTLLFLLVIGTLAFWYKSCGSINVGTVKTPKVEMFYWAAITFSQTLGTALGDWVADIHKFGYENAAIVFSVGLLVVTALYFRTKVSHALLFWAAFILTRPLGAALGDLLDKPIASGGFDISRPLISGILLLVVVILVVWTPQKAHEGSGSH
jgi:uncharacterized membrane-anchored protein